MLWDQGAHLALKEALRVVSVVGELFTVTL